MRIVFDSLRVHCIFRSALLPITTDYFADGKSLAKDYCFVDYTVSVDVEPRSSVSLMGLDEIISEIYCRKVAMNTIGDYRFG